MCFSYILQNVQKEKPNETNAVEKETSGLRESAVIYRVSDRRARLVSYSGPSDGLMPSDQTHFTGAASFQQVH